MENWNSKQQPDTQPGHYYVTASMGDKYFPMAGPFVDDHAAALAAVRDVMTAACEIDGRGHFMNWGTVRCDYDYSEPGPLNFVVGLPGTSDTKH